VGALNKEDAEKIARKLKAKKQGPTSAHDLWCVHHDTKVVAIIGIRRGSNRDAGHGHVANQIFETPHNAKLMAECTRTRQDWLSGMAAKGKLP
jgi:hypothetical protein